MATSLSQKLQLPKDVPVYAPVVPRGVCLPGVPISKRASTSLEAVLLFAKDRAALAAAFGKVAPRLSPESLVWICYPKGSSGVKTDLNRDAGWGPVQAAGLRPVRQIAIDEVWSALRFRPGPWPERA